MSKKVFFIGLCSVLMLGSIFSTLSVLGINDRNKNVEAGRTLDQENYNKTKKEVWNDYLELTTEYRKKLRESGEYSGEFAEQFINDDAESKANMDFDNILLDLLKEKNMAKDINLTDIDGYHHYIEQLCKLYNDKDISLNPEQIVRIELRLQQAYVDLYNEKYINKNSNEEETKHLQQIIKETITIANENSAATHE